jgi:phenylalanyl-tRNA synthetase alpha chain
MKEKLLSIKKQVIAELKNIQNSAQLEEVRIKYLGKKGELTSILRQMGNVSEQERPILGKLANQVRFDIENQLDDQKLKLSVLLIDQKIKSEKIDVTLPAKIKTIGKKSPLSLVLDELKDIFLGMAFQLPKVRK